MNTHEEQLEMGSINDRSMDDCGQHSQQVKSRSLDPEPAYLFFAAEACVGAGETVARRVSGC